MRYDDDRADVVTGSALRDVASKGRVRYVQVRRIDRASRAGEVVCERRAVNVNRRVTRAYAAAVISLEFVVGRAVHIVLDGNVVQVDYRVQ